ncbi:uncharacterized protein LOC132740402 isoform X2 [Ruditapes philippinarum]|uniref:uncharacterized protein LOC132740402 isoform X2 n=1 Tax=Ruditapes philippinarum TaxID=129788 RepID=UPI00295C0D1B|nr:uncharacterized protein LOC132740402 isoform X2 [Ruditapes philippinarum]
MNSSTRSLLAGIFLLALTAQLASSNCMDCSPCKVQISINNQSTNCPEMCRSKGSDPDSDFVKRCNQKFFCSINNCYCSSQACNGSARMG